MRPLIIEKSRVLLVEGKDEIMFFDELIKYRRVTGIQIIPYDGLSNLRPTIMNFPNLPNFKVVQKIGIVRDADNCNFVSIRQSINSMLDGAALDCPERFGLFTDGKLPQIGVFIVPNNKDKGAIENLCIQSIKNSREYFCVKLLSFCSKIGIRQRPKNLVQAYLALKVPLAKNLGIGAKKKHWPFGHPTFSSIGRFIEDLAT